MTAWGINVDPKNELARPDPVTLKAMGLDWPRIVARPSPEVEGYVRACYAAGLNVLGVLTPESFPFRAGAEQYRDWPVAAWQIGNEMDAAGVASASMDPGQWRNFYYAAMYGLGWPNVPIIAGGFASGHPELADAYLVVDGLTGYGCHPYAKDVDQMRALLRAYRARFPALSIWVTEWNRPASEIGSVARMLQDEQVPVACWFAWSDAQTLGTEGIRLGLSDEHGNPKPELAALLEVLGVAEFKFGFKDLADLLGPAIVGEPLEDEAYFPTGTHSLQVTTKGLMVYSKEGNKAGFVSFRQP